MNFKARIARENQRIVVNNLLISLIELGFDYNAMKSAFPNWESIDSFIYKYSKVPDTKENSH